MRLPFGTNITFARGDSKTKPDMTERAYGATSAALSSLLAGTQGYEDDLTGCKGYHVYKQMQTDAKVQGVLSQIYGMILGEGWKVVADDSDEATPEDAQAQADFVADAFTVSRGSWTDNMLDLLDAHAMGFAISEIVWDVRKGGKWDGFFTLKALKSKDPSTFGFDADEFGNVRGMKQINIGMASSGEIIPAEKFVIYSNRSPYGVPWGKSDLRAAYKAWWLKDWTQRWFGVFMQRCATPVPVGKYKRGTQEKQQTELLSVLNKLQSETALVIPDDVQTEFMQVATGSHEAFLKCLDWCDQQIASAIISQTLTSGEGSRVGSMALGKVHLDVLKANLRMMRERLTETINDQLIRRLIDYNFEQRFYPKLEVVDFTDDTLADWAHSLFQLVSSMPMQIVGPQDTRTIRDRLGLTAAWTEDDMTLPGPEPLAATDRTAEAASAEQAV